MVNVFVQICEVMVGCLHESPVAQPALGSKS